jgi:hypothetical protein
MPKRDAQDLRAKSKFIFQGTVDQLGAATVSSIAADKNTAVATVDAIEEGPPAMQAFRGKQVTVQLAPGESVQVGERATFYANPWIFGEGLALRSVGHTPVEPGAATMASSRGPVAHLLRQGVDKRIATADAVVTGRVLSVHLPEEESAAPAVARRGAAAAAVEKAPERISEHDPLWREAVVEVNDVQKGSAGKRQVVVRFPASRDVRWYRAPKFHPGQEGVFVLHKAEGEPAAGATAAMRATRRGPAGPEVYTALNANDFHPIGEAQGIDLLVRAQGGGTAEATPAPAAKRAAVKKSGAARTAVKAVGAKKAPARKSAAKRPRRKR